MRPAKWTLILAAIATPLRSDAYEVQLSLGSSAEYTYNIFREEHHPRDDVGFLISPTIRLAEPEGRLDWRIAYTPRYRWQLRFDQRNEVSHQLNARASYEFSPRTHLSFSDDLTVSENQILGRVDDTGDPVEDTEIDRQNAQTLRNNLRMSLEHQLTPRLNSMLSGSYRLTRYEQNNVSDIDLLSTNGSLSYAFTPRSRFGLGAGYSYTSFADRSSIDQVATAGRSSTIQALVNWVYTPLSRTTLRINGGPAYVIRRHSLNPIRRYPGPLFGTPSFQPAFRDLRSCALVDGVRTLPCNIATYIDPVFVQDADIPPGLGFGTAGELAAQTLIPRSQEVGNDEQWTIFGQILLSHVWKDLTTTLSYQRSETPNSGLGTTVEQDNVFLQLHWNLDRDWRTDLRLGYRHQTSIGEVVSRVTPIYTDSGIRGFSGPDTDGNGIPDNPDVPVAEFAGQNFETTKRGASVDQFSANLAVTRHVTRRLRAKLTLLGIIQRTGSQVEASTGRQYNDFRVNIGFDYAFEPFRF
jgi:hypothetical protein